MVRLDPYYEGNKDEHSPNWYAPNPHFEPHEQQGRLFSSGQFSHPAPLGAHRQAVATAREAGKRGRPISDGIPSGDYPGYRETRPTGYGPERSARIDARLAAPEFSSGMNAAPGASKGSGPDEWGIAAEGLDVSAKKLKVPGVTKEIRTSARKFQEDRTIEQIKRSTIPEHHLAGLNIEIGGGGDRGAYYSPMEHKMSLSSDSSEGTLLHETGHHVTMWLNGAAHKNRYDELYAAHGAQLDEEHSRKVFSHPDQGMHSAEIEDAVASRPIKRMRQPIEVANDEGMADNYRYHHDADPKGGYGQKSLHNNVRSLENNWSARSGAAGQGVVESAYTATRARWGQTPRWAGESEIEERHDPTLPGMGTERDRDPRELFGGK